MNLKYTNGRAWIQIYIFIGSMVTNYMIQVQVKAHLTTKYYMAPYQSSNATQFSLNKIHAKLNTVSRDVNDDNAVLKYDISKSLGLLSNKIKNSKWKQDHNSSVINIPTLFTPYFSGKNKITNDKKEDTEYYLKNDRYILLNQQPTNNSKIVNDCPSSSPPSTDSSEGVQQVTLVDGVDPDPLSKFAKFLGLFTVVQFTNEICMDRSSSNSNKEKQWQYGTCYHYTECIRLGGVAKGPCAQGHGVCCYVEQNCGQRTNANAAYFTGGSFFNTSEPGVYGCSIVIEKADSSVKQLRLDFQDFQIAGPLDGNCQIDRFIVSGQNSNNVIPQICGLNDGQHMYIDIDSVPGPVMLAVLSTGAKGLPDTFRIHIQQLRESSLLLAPSSCLQYYLSTNGVIKSFNYHNADSPPRSSRVQPGYMNNLNYAVCIKKQTGYCGVNYSNKAMDNSSEMGFELINLDDERMPTVPLGEAGAESYNCPDDYIVLNNMRLCGYRLNDASENSNLRENHPIKVGDNGPLVISLKTNSNVTGKGVYLQYNLQPCSDKND